MMSMISGIVYFFPLGFMKLNEPVGLDTTGMTGKPVVSQTHSSPFDQRSSRMSTRQVGSPALDDWVSLDVGGGSSMGLVCLPLFGGGSSSARRARLPPPMRNKAASTTQMRVSGLVFIGMPFQ